MTEAEVAPSFVQVSLPVPTAEEILDDLRNAPESDVVFSAPPAEPANVKSSRSEEVSQVVEDSVRFIRSYQRLEGEHRNVPPKIISDLKQYIHELTSEISTSSAR